MREFMRRTQGWAVIVALIGNGQEINTGEAGLAEWGRAITASGVWRAAAALELSATEYSCQGLELDVVGLVWGDDLLRERAGWRARRFAGTRWQAVRHYARHIVNTYRVLLTRARHETTILVPIGDADDPTRPPAEFDAIAQRLGEAGVGSLELSAAAARHGLTLKLL